jgi:tRNA-specific 2-thiouridylase
VLAATDHNLTLRIDSATEAVAPGQSCVLYRGEVCLGGGIIS